MNHKLIHPKILYTQTLMADRRWRGPFLAIALLFVNGTDRDGVSHRGPIREIATAVDVPTAWVHVAFRALKDQGYLSVDTDPRNTYMLRAIRPALEIESGAPSDVSSLHTQWILARARAWQTHQTDQERELEGAPIPGAPVHLPVNDIEAGRIDFRAEAEVER